MLSRCGLDTAFALLCPISLSLWVTMAFHMGDLTTPLCSVSIPHCVWVKSTMRLVTNYADWILISTALSLPGDQKSISTADYVCCIWDFFYLFPLFYFCWSVCFFNTGVSLQQNSNKIIAKLSRFLLLCVVPGFKQSSDSTDHNLYFSKRLMSSGVGCSRVTMMLVSPPTECPSFTMLKAKDSEVCVTRKLVYLSATSTKTEAPYSPRQFL